MRVELDPYDTSYYWEYFTGEGSCYYGEFDSDPLPRTKLSDFALTFAYPAEVGHTYEADGDPYVILDLAREITVPAGTFTCVLYETIFSDGDDPDFSVRTRYFLAPGVGLVRMEEDLRDKNGNWKLDFQDNLVTFDLGN